MKHEYDEQEFKKQKDLEHKLRKTPKRLEDIWDEDHPKKKAPWKKKDKNKGNPHKHKRKFKN